MDTPHFRVCRDNKCSMRFFHYQDECPKPVDKKAETKARKQIQDDAVLLAVEYAKLHDYYGGKPLTIRETSLMKLAIHAITEPDALRETIALMREPVL